MEAWPLVILAVLGALVYANSLSGVFLFDDFGSIVRNTQITNLFDWRAIWSPPADTPVAGRPLAHVSLALNYAVGGLSVTGFHLVNIALHVLCGALVFAIVRWTLDADEGLEEVKPLAASLALATAAIWLVHPLNTEVVDYLSQRTESLMAVCYLTAVYAAARAWRAPNPTRWMALAVVASLLGAFCKESIATVPIAIALYDGAFVTAGLVAAIRSRWRFYLALAMSWVAIAGELLLHGQTPASLYSTAPTSSWTYLLNQTEMIPHYLRLVVWPHDLVLFYGWPRALTLGDVWISGLALVAAAVLSIVLYLTRPRVGFCLLWVFVTLAPTSSIIPLATEVGAERRMYLPLAGLVALGVVGAAALLMRRRAGTGRAPSASLSPVAIGIATAMLCVPLSAKTMERNAEYGTSLGMAQTIVARWPSPAAEYLLGAELSAAGRHDEAITHLRAAVDDDPPAGYYLGAELFKTGHLDEAIDRLRTLIAREPNLPIIRPSEVMIARAFELKSDWPAAVAECELVLQTTPNDPDANGLLADALANEQQFAAAIPHYRTFLAAQPANPVGWTSLAMALVATHQGAEAVDAFRHATEAAPTDGHLQENLARALLDERHVDEAAAAATRALTLAPNDPAAHEVSGRVLAAEGRLDEARRELQRALALDPSYVPALDALRQLPIR